MPERALEITFLALIASLAFMQPQWDFFGPAVTFTEPLFLVALVIFVSCVATKRMSIVLDKTFIVFALYAAGCIVATIFSADVHISRVKLAGEIYILALAVLTFNIVRTREMMKKAVLVWLAATALSAVIGVLAIAFYYAGISNIVTNAAVHHYGSLPPGHYPRLQGTFLYPSLLCNYFTVSMMVLFAARRLEWLSNGVFAALLAAVSLTSAFTLTPGLGGTIFAVGAWYAVGSMERGRIKTARAWTTAGVSAAAASIIVSAFTIFPSPTSPFHWDIAGMRIDPAQRLLTWTDAFSAFLSHPIDGKGLGLGVAGVYFMPPSGELQLLTDAHNFVLNVAAQGGLIMVVPLLFICIAVVRRSLPFGSGDRDVLRTALGIAFISAFGVQGMVGSFEDARHLWVLIGLVLSSSALSPAFRRPDVEQEPAETGTQNATTALP